MFGRRSRGTTPARAGDPKRMRPGLVGAAGSDPALRTQGDGASGGAVEKQGSSSAPVMLVRDLMVEGDLLECNICFLPLKPPIFQCGVGHVLCSPCSKSDKIKDVGKCYVCGVALPGGYQRCHAMEDVINSMRGPCPNATYGCDATLVYHAREEHILQCPHAPCHCPGEECSFVGSKSALMDHCKTAHGWPCFTPDKASNNKGHRTYEVSLRDGFNLLVADLYIGKNTQGATANVQCLLLLTVARQPYVRIISVYCIDPHAAAASGGQGPPSKEIQCDLWYGYELEIFGHMHDQRSKFRVICTDLSNGLPDGSFQFIVSNPAIPYFFSEHDISVRLRLFI